jgi:transcriptional regulator with XRE-family HTH domain
MRDEPVTPPQSTRVRSPEASVGHRLRALRRQRNWTLDDLAGRSGVSTSTLRLIEADRANPTMLVLHRVAFSLGLPLAALVGEGLARPALTVIRGSDSAYVYRDEPAIQTRALSPIDIERDVEVYEVTLSAGGVFVDEPAEDNEWVVAVVERGRVGVKYGEAQAVLNPGEAAWLPSAAQATWHNPARVRSRSVHFEVRGPLRHEPLEDATDHHGQSGDTDEMRPHLAARVRGLRSRRRWTLSALAGRSGVSRSMLSQIERASGDVTLAVMRRLADAFGVGVQELVGGGSAAPSIEVLGPESGEGVWTSGPGIRSRLLSPARFAHSLNVQLLVLEPGVQFAGQYEANTWQIVCVRDGALSMTTGSEGCELRGGDSAYARGGQPWAFSAGPKGASLYVAVVFKLALG